MEERGITAYCLGNGALKCDGCGQEKNWQTLNQMPDARRLAMQKVATRINDTFCILAGRPFYIGPQPPKGGDYTQSSQLGIKAYAGAAP